MEDEQINIKVLYVVVVHDPGGWFEQTLRSLKEQEVDNAQYLIIDLSSSSRPLEVVNNVLGDVPVIKPEGDFNLTRSANLVLERVRGATHYFFCHDDILVGPDSTKVMLANMFKFNASVVSPKYVEWENARKLISVGYSCDRLGNLISRIEPDELDQGQHDTVREVAVASDGFLLVRTDLFSRVGGFDETLGFFGKDVEFSWATRLIGGKLITVPQAIVRKRTAFAAESRDTSASSVFSELKRAQFRSILLAYKGWRLNYYLTLATIFLIGEVIFSVLKGRPLRARILVGSLWFNLVNIKSLRAKKLRLYSKNKINNKEFDSQLASEFSRIRRFFERRKDPLNSYHLVQDELVDLAIPAKRMQTSLKLFLIFVCMLLISSLRNVTISGFPVIGQFGPFPSITHTWRSLFLQSFWAPVGQFKFLSIFFAEVLSFNSRGFGRDIYILGSIISGFAGSYLLANSIQGGAYKIILSAATAFLWLSLYQLNLGLNTGSFELPMAYALFPWICLVGYKWFISDTKPFLIAPGMHLLLALILCVSVFYLIPGLVMPELFFVLSFVALCFFLERQLLRQIVERFWLLWPSVFSLSLPIIVLLITGLPRSFYTLSGAGMLSGTSIYRFLTGSIFNNGFSYFNLASLLLPVFLIAVLNLKKSYRIACIFVASQVAGLIGYLFSEFNLFGGMSGLAYFAFVTREFLPFIFVYGLKDLKLENLKADKAILAVSVALLCLQSLALFPAIKDGVFGMSYAPNYLYLTEGQVSQVSLFIGPQMSLPSPGLPAAYGDYFCVEKPGSVDTNPNMLNANYVNSVSKTLRNVTNLNINNAGENLAKLGIGQVVLFPSYNSEKFQQAFELQLDLESIHGTQPLAVFKPYEVPAKANETVSWSAGLLVVIASMVILLAHFILMLRKRTTLMRSRL